MSNTGVLNMRKITYHKINLTNDLIDIEVRDRMARGVEGRTIK